MGEYFVGLAGTETGERLAVLLTLLSAFAHAVLGALSKQGNDPYLNRGAINIAYALVAAPFALFVFPLPEGFLVPVLFVSFLVHLAYEWLQSAAYSKGAFTLVYPIARGTGPLITAIAAIFVFSESLEPSQWGGLLLLSGAIMSLAWLNLRERQLDEAARAALRPSILLAIGAGIGVAAYTTIDAYGIRLTADPFTFLAWFFFLGGFGFPVVAFFRYSQMAPKPPLKPLISRGITGAFVALFSFGILMLATRIGKVSEVAALRETSIIFAIIIGFLFLGERLTRPKLFVTCLIALGAVLIEFH